MIVTFKGETNAERSYLTSEMFKLRARQFSSRRKWSVSVRQGMEFDHFDDLNPTYICSVTESWKLLGSLRVLSTEGPYMASTIFPETFGGNPVVRSPNAYECSRFCVDNTAAREFLGGVTFVTRELLWGLFSYVCGMGGNQIIAVHDLYMERILSRAGCIPIRIGPVIKYDGLSTVCSKFRVSKSDVATLSEKLWEQDTAYCESA